MEKEGFPELDPPCWLWSGLNLFGAIKDWFVSQSLNFFQHPVFSNYYFGQKQSELCKCGSSVSGRFWSHRA
jgi:hypothetical protein